MNKIDIIQKAIQEHHPLQFIYQHKKRIANPHHYGLLADKEQIHAYQTAGQTHSMLGWKNFKVHDMHHLKILETIFKEEKTYHPENAHYTKILIPLS